MHGLGIQEARDRKKEREREREEKKQNKLLRDKNMLRNSPPNGSRRSMLSGFGA